MQLNPDYEKLYEEFTVERLMQIRTARRGLVPIWGRPTNTMKNEAVRVFFAVIALILVAMLTSPGVDSPLNHPVQRRIAALENEGRSQKTIRKVIRVKKGKKITVSREET